MTKKLIREISLKDWINELGVAEVAKLLKVTDSTVRHWRRGHVLPRSDQMQKIVKLSRGVVTYSTMIDGFDFNKAERK